MKLKNKALALAIASAVAAPSAFAVEGSDGMHYTSASEGFYASIRVRYNSGGSSDANGVIQNSSSRLGIQGTGEMSHGLEGFYRYETAFDVVNGDQGFTTNRLGYVGLRGGFGSFRVGSDWADEYNYVVGSTDIANVNSGNFAYNDDYAGRSSRSLFYQSPDFNGAQVAVRFELDGGSSDTGDMDPNGNTVADSDLDAWALSGKYDFGGFTVAGTYTHRPDYIAMVAADGAVGNPEDKSAWAVRGGFSQDNWRVNLWYGENNASDYGYHYEAAVADDTNTADVDETREEVSIMKSDETVFSISGSVDIGKSSVYVVHESKEDLLANDASYTALGVEYRLNSKSKTWIEYASQDVDSNANADDYVTIGLRHDF